MCIIIKRSQYKFSGNKKTIFHTPTHQTPCHRLGMSSLLFLESSLHCGHINLHSCQRETVLVFFFHPTPLLNLSRETGKGKTSVEMNYVTLLLAVFCTGTPSAFWPGPYPSSWPTPHILVPHLRLVIAISPSGSP